MAAYADLPLTVDALEGAPDDGNRYEVIEGELYVSTAPGYPHQTALLNLAVALGNYLEERPIGQALPGVGIVFDLFNGVIPDLLYVSNERFDRTIANNSLNAAPEIVVEILSPGAANEKRDRIIKRKLYSSRGVDEYWLLDPEARTVEVSRKRKEGGLDLAVTLHLDEDLTTTLLPGFRVSLARIFRHRLPPPAPTAV